MDNLLTQLDCIENLECENESSIIEAFMDRYDVGHEEALNIFEETKKWLWLASKKDVHGEVLFIDKPLLIIDEMWHNFILHTRSYYNFCLKHFKKLIHHTPTPKSEQQAMDRAYLVNPSEVIKEHEEKVNKQYSLIYEHLGPETLLKWYDTIAQKYTPEYIQSIKK